MTVAVGGGTAVNKNARPPKSTAPYDYAYAPTKTVTIKAGHLEAFVNIRATRDNIVEPDEFFNVHITSANTGINRAQGTVTIKDTTGVAPGVLLFGTSSIVETNGNATYRVVAKASVVLSQPDPVNTITVKYRTADAGATAGADYLAKPAKATSPPLTLTFKPGHTEALVAVTVLGDTIAEPTEGIDFAFTNAVNAALSNGSTAHVDIIDND
jgi:hypothetical protein